MPKRRVMSAATMRAVETMSARVSARGTSRERMWMVTGTTASAATRSSSPAAPAPPQCARERAEKFGVAGKREAGVVERRLGDRVGDDRARLAGSHVADRALDRFDRRGARRRDRARRASRRRARERDDRQRAVERRRAPRRASTSRSGTSSAEPPRQCAQRARDRRARRTARRSPRARSQARKRQFRADAGGVAHRQRERRRRGARRSWMPRRSQPTSAHCRPRWCVRAPILATADDEPSTARPSVRSVIWTSMRLIADRRTIDATRSTDRSTSSSSSTFSVVQSSLVAEAEAVIRSDRSSGVCWPGRS